MNNKELAELAERVRAMSDAELVAFRSGQSEYTSVQTIFFEKEFERRERLEQRKLDLKLMAERVRWRKSAARLTAGASIVAAIVGAIAGATLALWLQPNPTLKQSESFTSGRAGGLICEPLKAVWPAYAGIFYSNIFSCSSLLSSFSCSRIYSRICVSSRPTVDT